VLPRSPMARVVSVVTAAVKNRFRRKARPPNRGGFEVLEPCPLQLMLVRHYWWQGRMLPSSGRFACS